MIKRLYLRNFKAFGDQLHIDFAPITLIYGANSSGKSSILQSLLLLQQTLSPTVAPDVVLNFRGEGGADLTSFENVVYAHDLGSSIDIGVGTRLPAARPGSTRRSTYAQTIKAASSGMVISFVHSKTKQIIVDQVALYFEDETFPALILRQLPDAATPPESPVTQLGSKTQLGIDSINEQSIVFRQLFEQYERRTKQIRLREMQSALEFLDSEGVTRRGIAAADIEKFKAYVERQRNHTFESFIEDVREEAKYKLVSLVHFLPNRVIQKGSPIEAIQTYFPFLVRFELVDFGELILPTAIQISKEIANIGYIGPFREQPERNYIYSGSKADFVGSRGQNLPDLLFSNKTYQKDLSELANELGLRYDIKITQARSKELNEVFAVRLVDRDTKTNVGLNDVGFGVSQVLPLLLESTLLGRRIVLMEQPEIHIHPRLQAALANILVKGASNPLHKQFIVETHSEHLLLRLQRLIRDGELPSEMVKVLFVSRDRRGSHIKEVRLGSEGELLDHWPDDFFDDAYHEVFG